MRIKLAGLFGYILLLSNSIHALDLARYCCCLKMFQSRYSRESFASTDTANNYEYQCFEENLDGQTVMTFIQKPTQPNQTEQDRSHIRNLSATKDSSSNNYFTQHNTMGYLPRRTTLQVKKLAKIIHGHLKVLCACSIKKSQQIKKCLPILTIQKTSTS